MDVGRLSPQALPTPLVCAECLRVDRDGDGRGWRADWVGGHDDEPIELVVLWRGLLGVRDRRRRIGDDRLGRRHEMAIPKD